jgi:hypothetical protein
MVEVFIDSASIYEVLLALSRTKPEQSYKLEWDRALEVTAAFISTDQLRLPPSPESERSASGPYGILLSGLQDVVEPITLPNEVVSASIRKTKIWGDINSSLIRNSLGRFTGQNTDNIDIHSERWLNSHIEHVWIEQTTRRGCLFDNAFETQIASILNVNRRDVAKIHSMCCDQLFVASLVKKQNDSDKFRLARDSFLISTLLRGTYYTYIAELTQRQIMSHPARQVRTTTQNASEKIRIVVSNYEKYIANIIVAGSLSETSHSRRVSLWVDNVSKIRRARGRIKLEDRKTDEMARDDAISDAKRFGVHVHSKRLELCMDAVITLGCGALTAIYLSPFTGFLTSGAMYGLQKRYNLGEKALDVIKPTRLSALSTLAPGQIKEL